MKEAIEVNDVLLKVLYLVINKKILRKTDKGTPNVYIEFFFVSHLLHMLLVIPL